MKIVQKTNEKDPSLFQSYLEIEENEDMLEPHEFRGLSNFRYGELFIPNGITTIKKHTFYGSTYSKIHFPKSISCLEDALFSPGASESYPFFVKIIYEGSSDDFMKIATIREESVYESDGFDRYPYYSGGGEWVTYYRAFDSDASEIEVECVEDGVTLLYGTQNRKDGESPKIKNK